MRIAITRMTSLEVTEDIEIRTQGDIDIKLLAKAFNLGREQKSENSVGMHGEEYRRYQTGSIFTDPTD